MGRFSSVAKSCLILCGPMDYSTPGFPVHHQLLEPVQTHVHWADAIQPSHPLSSPSPPGIRVFSNETALRIRWTKYWSFSISPSNGYSGLISFRMDWLDLLAVQGTLKNLLQHHISKASILRCSAFFIVQLTSILFNMLSRLVITFLPRTKNFLLSGLQSPSAVI